MRRIIVEGLEEGGRVLSPRFKTNIFILKIDRQENKTETKF